MDLTDHEEIQKVIDDLVEAQARLCELRGKVHKPALEASNAAINVAINQLDTLVARETN